MVAHERPTERSVTIECLLLKPSSLSDLPAFPGPYGTNSIFQIKLPRQSHPDANIASKSFLLSQGLQLCSDLRPAKNRDFLMSVLLARRI